MTRNEILSVAKPILFNTDMVRAIQDGRKKQTRRVAMPNKDLREFRTQMYPNGWWLKGRVYKDWENLVHDIKMSDLCKYKIGDYLYVRETWALQQGLYWHKAGLIVKYGRDPHGVIVPAKWQPSIHMPKYAARIFLRVTDVRVERLQNISGQGLIDEGLFSQKELSDGIMRDKFSAFESLWNSTVKKSDLDRYGWEANPWVWVITFERVEVR